MGRTKTRRPPAEVPAESLITAQPVMMPNKYNLKNVTLVIISFNLHLHAQLKQSNKSAIKSLMEKKIFVWNFIFDNDEHATTAK